MHTILARWSTLAPPSSAPHPYEDKIHVYEIPIMPAQLLQTGDTVRVAGISRIAYHTPNRVAPRYNVYDPHIAGAVVGVAGEKDGVVALEVANDCPANPVRRVILLVPRTEVQAQGATVLGLREGYPEPPFCIRQSALERDVVVEYGAERMCGGRQCVVKMRYMDPVKHFGVLGERNVVERKVVPRSRRRRYEP